MGIFKKLRESFSNFKNNCEVLKARPCENRLKAQHVKLFKNLVKTKVVQNALNVGDKVRLKPNELSFCAQ